MTTEEKIAVMQALVEGKEIEVAAQRDLSCWIPVEIPAWNWEECVYRIKQEPPKPKVRPYKDAEELMEAIKVHGAWVRDNKGGYFAIGVIASRDGRLIINGNVQDWYLENVMFADGTPFGVEEGGSNG